METIMRIFSLQTICWFKSYYVVWKHKRMQKDREKFKKFKSYYVVWKLFSDTKAFFRAYGLNRTM